MSAKTCGQNSGKKTDKVSDFFKLLTTLFTPLQDTQLVPKLLSASKAYDTSVPPTATITLKGAFTAASKRVKPVAKSNEEEEKTKKNKKRKMCTAQFNCPHPEILSSTTGKKNVLSRLQVSG